MAGLPGPMPADVCALEAGPGPQAGGAGARPFLRWAGSKRKLIARLSKYWSHKHARYVEPFAGSACLFFHVAPGRAILGDINRELIETYEQVRDATSAVVAALSGFRKGKARYLLVRALEPSALAPAERAARFIYLNRCCFNGLYRTNREGRFNVPYGGKRSGKIPKADRLRSASKALRGAKLIEGDFTKLLQKIKDGDFVYMDPPFSITEHRMFNE